MSSPREPFDDLFAGNDDPWRFRTRWYEARKRAVLLACLPAARYRRAYEPGCANGELTVVLADRCDRLLASDGVARAVALTRDRVAKLPHVQVIRQWVPQEWPAGQFDLIVLSELCYYLSTPDMLRLVEKCRLSIAAGGSVVACHWRHPISRVTPDAVGIHRVFHANLGLKRQSRYQDDDFILDLWSSEDRSVAQREGIVASECR